MGRTEVSVRPGQVARAAVPLAPFSSLAGRVLDEAGSPVAGLFVLAASADPDAAMDIGASLLSGDFPRTDRTGRFRLEKVRPGKGSVRFLARAAQLGSVDYEVGPGERKDLGEIRLEGAGNEPDDSE
jgi:hypothetical protein